MTVKKAYQDIVALLDANRNVKVEKIIDQVIALASAKAGGGGASTFIKDAAGNTVAILDYYFKRWMPLVGSKAVEFGAKQKTATGFNSMSKEGVSHWTKQQREAKNANSDLLKRVAAGEVSPADIPAEQEKIEAQRKMIAPTELGFDTVDALVEYLRSEGIEVDATAVAA